MIDKNGQNNEWICTIMENTFYENSNRFANQVSTLPHRQETKNS